MNETATNDKKLLGELEKISTLLEDLFILEASRMGMKKEPLRQILRIDKLRIGRIAKHVKIEKPRTGDKEGAVHSDA